MLACVHATSRVRRDSSSERFSGVSFGFVVESPGFHHLITSFCCLATSFHGVTLASWSMADRTISSPASNWRAKDRLRRSCVAEDPYAVEMVEL